MASEVEAAILKRWLSSPAELALIDVRELRAYGDGHPFFAVPVPYSRLEVDLPRLVPRLATRVVLFDDGASGIAQLCARRMESAGYSDVGILKGGVRGWAAAGFRLYAGVNVPSKAFGELVEEIDGTPHLSARELARLQQEGEDLVVVDGRPWTEFRKMSIPGGICCPNGELALRIERIAPDPRTRVVVNCAGRTRSIIGAQTLRHLGLPNPVYALEDGTQGWFLSGLELEHQATRRYPAAPDGADLERLRSRSTTLAARFGVPLLGAAEAQALLDDRSRTTYLFDVRSPEEYEAGSLPGARSAPGGQLVQATDQWIAVRSARLLLFDSEGVRAIPIAAWLRRMGHDARVVREGIASGVRARAELPRFPLPELPECRKEHLGEAPLIDLRPSETFQRARVPGSIWSIRPKVAKAAKDARRVALIADEPMIARAAALDLREGGVEEVCLLAQPSLEPAEPMLTPEAQLDVVGFAAGRHDGNRDAALQYLSWEKGLLAMLDAQERASFRL